MTLKSRPILLVPMSVRHRNAGQPKTPPAVCSFELASVKLEARQHASVLRGPNSIARPHSPPTSHPVSVPTSPPPHLPPHIPPLLIARPAYNAQA
eukprot:3225959-Rhodomonas_salina.2